MGNPACSLLEMEQWLRWGHREKEGLHWWVTFSFRSWKDASEVWNRQGRSSAEDPPMSCVNSFGVGHSLLSINFIVIIISFVCSIF